MGKLESESLLRKEGKETLPKFKIDLPKVEFENYDNSCMQTSIAMILKDFEKDYQPDLEELNEVSHKEKRSNTWPGWILLWLKERGYQTELYSKLDWKKFTEEGENYLDSEEFQKRHGNTEEEARALKKFITQRRHRMEQAIKSGKIMIENEITIHLLEKDKEPKEILKNIFEKIKAGERAIFSLKTEGAHAGFHAVPVTGFDGEYIYYNNPLETGTEVDKKEKLEDFVKRWSEFNINEIITIKS